MEDAGERLGLPQITEIELMRRLLSEDLDTDLEEPAVAAGIGEQMLHMGMRPMPRSMRARIRDTCSKLPAKNAILIGGGIGHLAAWLLDLWCGGMDGENSPRNARPETFRIVEPGSRFGVIIDRLIRRYGHLRVDLLIEGASSETISASSHDPHRSTGIALEKQLHTELFLSKATSVPPVTSTKPRE